jgi:hypothetical protein
MTNLNEEIHSAFKKLGASDEDAKRPAAAYAELEQRTDDAFNRIDRSLLALRLMVGGLYIGMAAGFTIIGWLIQKV